MNARYLSLLLVACAAALTAQAQKADRVLLHGNVWTGDPSKPRAQAIAIRGARILAVGSDSEIKRLAEKQTTITDLKGRFVCPGFQDAHLHFMSGSLGLESLSVVDAGSVAEIQKRVAAFAKAHPDRAWIIGRGWDYGLFDGGKPNRKLIDAVVADRPVVLYDRDGHVAWCNTSALSAALVTRTTQNPPGGLVVKDETGGPTGELKETAQVLVRSVAPLPNAEDKYRALKRGLDLAASYGLTSVQNAWFDLSDLPVYERVLDEGGLKLRVYSALPMVKDISPEDLARYQELKQKSRPLLRFGAVKGLVDGTVDAGTAVMLEPYTTGGNGLLRWSKEDLDRTVALYDREGFQVLLHAIGDRSIRMALDAYEAAARVNATSGRRHRVEHIEVPAPEDVPRFKALGVIASTQAIFANPDKTTLENYALLLGPARAARANSFKQFDDAGAVQAFGSDWPVFSMEVLKGIHAAVARTTPEGTPVGGWYPAGRITTEAALAHFTRDAAYASFAEGDTGQLKTGRYADFVVLSEDIVSSAPERLLMTNVMLTVMGGNDTFRALEF
jgi:predicted amidohydrolase YtcJ